MVDRGIELGDLEAVAAGFAQVDEEDGDAIGAALDFVGGRGAGEKQHEVGLQRARGWSTPSGR